MGAAMFGTAFAAAAPLAAQSEARGFTHSVASGEPGPTSVLLWTRYVTSDGYDVLRFEVSSRMDFAKVAAEGNAPSTAGNDHCAKGMATGLDPDSWYYYRFIAPDGTISAIGRTRTLPEGPTQRFRMAVFSCSNIGFGYFNAYAHAAEANDFDLAVHTGDYFYEYGLGTYPSAEESLAGRMIDPQSEIVSLADYRTRYANYRKDTDLQRLHQLYPMIAGWDDHESANDSWKGGAENHQPGSEGEWSVRKRAAMRAYREWMPVSDEPSAAYEIGDLATVFRLETRLRHRDAPPDIGAVLKGTATADEAVAALEAFRDGAWRDPAREMLGADQQAWLTDGMKRSRAAGKTWQVLAQQVIMGQLKMSPNVADGLTDKAPGWLRDRLKAAAAASSVGLPFNMDAWDGYPAARGRLLSAAQEADANLVVLAGDSHNGWAFDLDHDGAPAGVEFAGHSVSSPGAESTLSWIAPDTLAADSVAANDQLKWANTKQRGYMAVELTPTRATSEYRFMAGIKQRSTALAGSHIVGTDAGTNTLSDS